MFRKLFRKVIKKESTRKRIKKVAKVLFIIFCSIFGLMLIAGVAGWLISRPLINECRQEAFDKLNKINENTFTLMENTEIYDKDDNLLASINVSNYKYAPIGDVSEYIIHGYMAVEDRRFLQHNGIDYKSLLRAGLALIKNRGEITQGGSTITQQVCKNIFLSQERSFKRKLIEFYMAPEIEKKYSKNDIMEFYVNSNFYWYNCYGVESASQYYFGKTAKNLTLAEAATIVGCSNNPSLYNPVDNPEQALKKRRSVLAQMLDCGYITQEEHDEAYSEELTLVLKRDKRDKESYTTSYAIRCTALELMRRDNFNFKYTFNSDEEYNAYKEEYNNEISRQESRVRSGGFKIYTSFDTDKQNLLQSSLDEVLSDHTETDRDTGKYKFQGGAVSIDNETGYVVAIVGGRGTEDEFNRGFLAVRQPGSAIKPVIDYGPAFDTGRYYPSLKVKDEAIKNGPHNSYSGYLGKISVREAIARSTNTVAYNTLLDVKPSTGLEYMSKMEFDTLSDKDNVGSIALGGFTYGVRVADLAKAYYTIQNRGMYDGLTCLRRVEFQNNGVVYEAEKNNKAVYNEDTAYMLTSCLQGVVERPEGTGKIGKLDGYVSACKTGTTDDKKDGWFCGFTPYYTTAVWVGYDTPKETPDLAGSTYPGRIWKTYMSQVHEGLPYISEFERPETIKDCFIDNDGNKTDSDTGVTDIFSGIIETELAKTQSEINREIWTAQEEANKVTEEKRISVAENAVTEFESIKCDSVENLMKLDLKYKESIAAISNITDYKKKQELERRVNIKKAKVDIERQAYDELAEIEKQQKMDEEANKKATDAEVMSKALGYSKQQLKNKCWGLINELSAVERPSYNEYVKLGKLGGYVETFKGTNDYNTLNQKYESLRRNFDNFIKNQSAVKDNNNAVESTPPIINSESTDNTENSNQQSE